MKNKMTYLVLALATGALQASVMVSLDFSNQSDLSQLEFRDSHNDYAGWDEPVWSVGELAMRETVADTLVMPDDSFSLSAVISYSATADKYQHFFQVGVTSDYNTYSDSGGNVHEGGRGQLFGPGTEFSYMFMDRFDGAKVDYMTGWGSSGTAFSSASKVFQPDENITVNFSGTKTDEFGTYDLQLDVLNQSGITIVSHSTSDYLDPSSSLSISGLHNNLTVHSIDAQSSGALLTAVPEPSSVSLVLAFAGLTVALVRRK